jgi:GxxExxY protein
MMIRVDAQSAVSPPIQNTDYERFCGKIEWRWRLGLIAFRLQPDWPAGGSLASADRGRNVVRRFYHQTCHWFGLRRMASSPERWRNFGSRVVRTSKFVSVHPFEIFTTENTEDHGTPREFFMLEHQALTERIIGLAIEVHRIVGPGLLESVYAECMALELARAGISFEAQVTMPVIYKGVKIPLGFRADVVIENTVILEIKAVAALLPAHESQLLTYLRMSNLRIGLLMNFHAPRLKDGLRRFVV